MNIYIYIYIFLNGDVNMKLACVSKAGAEDRFSGRQVIACWLKAPEEKKRDLEYRLRQHRMNSI